MTPIPQTPQLGTCYYPEHWPEARWGEDAARMAALGLSVVRIGEFAWSRMEPAPGRYNWGWLDRAVETLGAAGLQVVLCTPTPTPPKWLTDAHPSVLRVDAHGKRQRHGSRRHISVAAAPYRRFSQQITHALVNRYGANPAIVGWQTDNEYGCHDSTLSYGVEDGKAFVRWLAARYDTVAALNAAWGTAFWSQTYDAFDDVEVPNLLTAGANPAHWLDFRRFFSDMTRDFNREQVQIIRAGSPGRFVTHNFMFFEAGFDHWDVAADLSFASWDSYPLGFLRQFHERAPTIVTADDLARYAHTGHPDIVPFHHDLYRAMAKTKDETHDEAHDETGDWTDQFWIMEQQPGPVNWASYNVAPSDGMVQAWTLEGMAHGAQTVSYFRWRQAPWAQEQLHTGLNTPWYEWDRAGDEVRALAPSLPQITPLRPRLDPATTLALYVDYQTQWAFEALGQGADLDARHWAFTWYQAARQLGLDVEMFGPKVWTAANVTGLKLAVLPCQLINQPALNAFLLGETGAHLCFGPRSGAQTAHLAYANQDPLCQGPPQAFAPPPYLSDGQAPLFPGLAVRRVESLPPEAGLTVNIAGNAAVRVRSWAEHLTIADDLAEDLADDSALAPFGSFAAQGTGRRSGLGMAGAQGARATYLGFHPDTAGAKQILRHLALENGLEGVDLADDVRVRRTAGQVFVSNYGPKPAPWGDAAGQGHTPLIGANPIPPGSVAVFEGGKG